jgi:FkbM family methyltransferase
MQQNLKHNIKSRLGKDELTLFDVGAKGGAFMFPKLKAFVRSYGFEPNEEEFAKLKEDEKQIYFPYALSENGGDIKLNITNHASYSSVLDFDAENFKSHFHLMKGYQKWKIGMQVEQTAIVTSKSLNEAVTENEIDTVDFIKLDTQGTELSILKGGKALLNQYKIGIIFCEVSFVQSYKNQNLFSELDLYLRAQDYEFIDCRYYPDGVGKNQNIFSKKLYDKPRFSVGGDAIFVPNISKVDLDSAFCFRIGLLLAALNHFAMAHNFLKKSNLPDSEIDSILKYFNEKSPQDIIRNWIPPILYQFLRQLRLKFKA